MRPRQGLCRGRASPEFQRRLESASLTAWRWTGRAALGIRPKPRGWQDNGREWRCGETARIASPDAHEETVVVSGPPGSSGGSPFVPRGMFPNGSEADWDRRQLLLPLEAPTRGSGGKPEHPDGGQDAAAEHEASFVRLRCEHEAELGRQERSFAKRLAAANADSPPASPLRGPRRSPNTEASASRRHGGTRSLPTTAERITGRHASPVRERRYQNKAPFRQAGKSGKSSSGMSFSIPKRSWRSRNSARSR